MRFRLFLIAWLAGGAALHAQVRVEVSVNRGLYIRYEPIVATVSLTNLSGRELELSDDGSQPWFGFQIQTSDGRPVSTRTAGYQLNPAQVGPGQSLTRQINLTPIYAMDQFGGYRIRASVFLKSDRQFYSSPPISLEITDGRQVWQQKVGVPVGQPDEGTTRTITLLAHRLPQSTALYIRIEDPERGRIFCTHRIGRFVNFGPPTVELDSQNQVHILQLLAPRNYLYSHFGLNGEVLDRKLYTSTGTPPRMQRTPDGFVQVVGGQFLDPNAAPAEKPEESINARPVPLPNLPGSSVKPPSPAPAPSIPKAKKD
ncbi:MAG TPA: hypothetical protein VIS74_03250 [Chthoniobacterales bacterium]